jgi:hypothetical protein
MNNDDWNKRDRTELLLVLSTVALGMLLFAAALFGWFDAEAAERDPPCGTTPTPPLELVLPDGTVIAVHDLTYDLALRRVTAVGAPRLYCDGFEGT